MRPIFEARDPDFEEVCRASFARQSLMTTLGVTIESVAPGYIELRLPKLAGSLQQHGFVHGGAVAAVADVAAGFAARSVMGPGTGVLTVEFKINFVSPAAQDVFIARGRVEKSGRTLVVVRTDVVGLADGREVPVAILSGTMMAIENRAGIVG